MLVLNLSLLNRAYTLINVLIEYYTMIFYAIYKWNFPSIQCKNKLRWSSSMREVNCPSLVFIDFNVPMLTRGRVGVF
jgi:hypothetical protein